MKYSMNQLRDFSSLFSRSEVSRWFKNDFDLFELKLERYNLSTKNIGKSYLQVLRQIYRVLEENYPNEYILKNEFITKWLKKELGNENSLILNEFRLGKAIADLAMFNGMSKVFEIKTILDKDYRLTNQLREYKKLFNEIYIIIPYEVLSKYQNYSEDIGIISYSSKSGSESFTLINKPKINNFIDINVLMETLHSSEYLNIVNKFYKESPEMNSFNQFDICKNLISKIPYEELNKLFIEEMKRRKIHNHFFNKVNREFNQICLSLNMKLDERNLMIKNLKSVRS